MIDGARRAKREDDKSRGGVAVGGRAGGEGGGGGSSETGKWREKRGKMQKEHKTKILSIFSIRPHTRKSCIKILM